MKQRFLLLILSVAICFTSYTCANDTYFREGSTLYLNQKYKLAIERCDLQLEETPKGVLADKCEELIRVCYQDWIREELAFKRYENVLDLMKILFDRFPDSPETQWARGQHPQVSFWAAKELLEEGVITEGSRGLREYLTMYPDDTHVEEARQALDSIGIIAFVMDNNIWISMADGRGARMVMENAINPNLSSDGKSIAYIKPSGNDSETGRLYCCDIDGRKEKMLRKSPISFRPKWSFDMRKMAVSKTDFFQVLDLKSGRVRTIRPNELGYSGDFDSFGDWSNDGKTWICYLHEAEGENHYICRVSPDMEKAFRLSTEKSPIRDLDLSFDDKVIAFSTSEGLYIMDAKGTNRKTLMDKSTDGLDVFCISWSPSGESILFVAQSEDGNYSLYIINKERIVLPVVLQGVGDAGIQPLGCSWVSGTLPKN